MEDRLAQARRALDEALDRRLEAYNAYLQASALYVLALAEHNRAAYAEDEARARQALGELLEACPTELTELRATLIEQHVLRKRTAT